MKEEQKETQKNIELKKEAEKQEVGLEVFQIYKEAGGAGIV